MSSASIKNKSSLRGNMVKICTIKWHREGSSDMASVDVLIEWRGVIN